MSTFTWNFRGIIAYNPNKHSIEELDGWWRHVGFGICIFIKKETAGWGQA